MIHYFVRARIYCDFAPIQIFTGAVPFSGCHPLMAVLSVTQGKRPPRPTHPAFTEVLWTLMQRCWDHDPHLRPEASEVSQILLTTSAPYPSGQPDSALELSRSLQAQLTSAQDTIRLLEVKVVELQQLAQATQDKVDDQQAHQAAIKEVMESMRVPEKEREKERKYFAEIINEWMKGVEGKWTSVQEEWSVERDRLRRARDEWESKTKTIQDSVLARVESRLPPIQPRYNGSGTSPRSPQNSHWTDYEAEDEGAYPQNVKTARKNGRAIPPQSLRVTYEPASDRNTSAGDDIWKV